MTLPAPGSRPRGDCRSSSDGKPLAALVHDPSAAPTTRELLHAAGAAARLALENARLHAELRAQLDEVQASRARIVDAGDDERRRIERDLHDGAQQRLVALALEPRARSVAGSGRLGRRARTRCSTTPSHELSRALAELRELARGMHPAILSEAGLGPALDVARRAFARFP